jgi:hypothetical protein
MRESEVIERLGPPESRYSRGYAPGHTLQYGSSGSLASSNVVLWVHIAADGQVHEVYAKLYNTWEFGDQDEVGVLGRGVGTDWESRAFNDAFPSGSGAR